MTTVDSQAIMYAQISRGVRSLTFYVDRLTDYSFCSSLDTPDFVLGSSKVCTVSRPALCHSIKVPSHTVLSGKDNYNPQVGVLKVITEELRSAAYPPSFPTS